LQRAGILNDTGTASFAVQQSLTISAKPVGATAMSQRLIPKGERSGLQTHRGDGKRFVVHAEELLTAFVELVAAT
jgi:hypothetical protein